MNNPLGKNVPHSDVFDPSLLFPIARAQSRVRLGIREPLSFDGVDRWTCYELAWLDSEGYPILGVASIEYPASSEMLVESKSLKLFLGSMNFTRFASIDEVTAAIREALQATINHSVISVSITPVSEWATCRLVSPPGECVDSIRPTAHHGVRLKSGEEEVEETLYSNLLRSLCPVTGQPDWGSVVIRYRGKALDRESLFSYLVMHRSYQGFHEECCERLFSDVMAACAPSQLWVGCFYTRRGGIDINPERWISGTPRLALGGRLTRQ
jgi:7-cyano-7-deazaguanine reductase